MFQLFVVFSTAGFGDREGALNIIDRLPKAVVGGTIGGTNHTHQDNAHSFAHSSSPLAPHYIAYAVPSENNTAAAFLLTPGKRVVKQGGEEGQLVVPFPGYPALECGPEHPAFCMPYSKLEKDCEAIAAAASFTCTFSSNLQQLKTTVHVPFTCPIEKAATLEDVHHHDLVNSGPEPWIQVVLSIRISTLPSPSQLFSVCYNAFCYNAFCCCLLLARVEPHHSPAHF
jgi:hypothetical protein